jgi:hypothetical protein
MKLSTRQMIFMDGAKLSLEYGLFTPALGEDQEKKAAAARRASVRRGDGNGL